MIIDRAKVAADGPREYLPRTIMSINGTYSRDEPGEFVIERGNARESRARESRRERVKPTTTTTKHTLGFAEVTDPSKFP